MYKKIEEIGLELWWKDYYSMMLPAVKGIITFDILTADNIVDTDDYRLVKVKDYIDNLSDSKLKDILIPFYDLVYERAKLWEFAREIEEETKSSENKPPKIVSESPSFTHKDEDVILTFQDGVLTVKSDNWDSPETIGEFEMTEIYGYYCISAVEIMKAIDRYMNRKDT